MQKATERARSRPGDRRHLPHRRRRRLGRSAPARPARARARHRAAATSRRKRRGATTATRRAPDRSRRGVGCMLADERRRRLLDAMAEAGLDGLVVYGNAWQGDYLRYATDFGILEGQALAVVAATATIDALSRQRQRGRPRRALDCPGVEVVLRARSRRRGRCARSTACATSAWPRRRAAFCRAGSRDRAAASSSSDDTALRRPAADAQADRRDRRAPARGAARRRGL